MIASLPANSTSYGDTGLTSGVTYYYRVVASNVAAGGSGRSVVAVATLE